ncbi:MAG: hypothetical protein AAF737_09070, partial [Pseudomonadota bacterium]
EANDEQEHRITDPEEMSQLQLHGRFPKVLCLANTPISNAPETRSVFSEFPQNHRSRMSGGENTLVKQIDRNREESA